MESLKTGSLLALFLAIVSTSGSTGLHLGVSFEQLNEVVKDKMHLKCAGDGTVHGPRMTLMMKLGKDGDPKPLAVFNLGTGITMTPMNVSKTITAVGHVDKVSSQIFLTVTIDRPDEKDTGTYRCQLLYMDQQHHIQEEKELLKVVIEAPDTSTIMKYLIHQVEDLKDTVRFQMEIIRELKATQNKTTETIATQNKTIADLNTRADNLRDSVKANTKSTQSHDRVLADLNATDIAMRDQFQDFKTNATYQCAFRAQYNQLAGEKVRLEYSRIILFTNITLNLGGAYNPETGVFTAPVDGVYVFHLTIRTKSENDYVNVFLRVNQQDRANVHAWNLRAPDLSSLPSVFRLQAGDKVDPQLFRFKGSKHLSASTFSGYLLQAS